jgi:hypothetical protein
MQRMLCDRRAAVKPGWMQLAQPHQQGILQVSFFAFEGIT